MSDSIDFINPQSLKAVRKRRKLSQQKLAEKIGCTKDTVSRWERGKSRKVRSHLCGRLCKVLRVDWEELTQLNTEPQLDSGNLKTKVTIRKDVRASLQLVAKRFNVHQSYVLGLAPLLFLIVAERSLLKRQRRLEESTSILQETEKKLLKNCTHLHGAISASYIVADNQLQEEAVSLSKRDIFGRTIQYEYWDEGDEGPFVQFIRDLLQDLPKDAVTSIDSFDGDMVEIYRIADDTLRECTGISQDEESGKHLLHYIQCGLIDFSECLRIKRDETEENYHQWLSDELARADEESSQILKQFMDDDSISGNADTSDSPDARGVQ